MAEQKDFYEVLGVEKGATDDQLKSAFRKKAKQYHPDANPDNKKEAEAKFKEINEAYETLSDPQKRKMYDQFGTADPQGFGGFGGGNYSYSSSGFDGFDGFDFGFGDIFNMFTGGGRTSRTNNGPRKGTDLRYTMDITFEESFSGVEKDFTISRMEECNTCNGNGAKPGTSPETCSVCHGSGQIKQVQTTILGQMQTVKVCDHCHGTGKVIKEPCDDCKGKGKTRKQAKLRVKIPAGIAHDQTIVLRNEGEPGDNGGSKGDLFITIRVKKHSIFTRKGDNVECTIPITMTQATLGATLEIPLVDGTKENYKIGEGTQNGTKYTIKNKGFKSINGNYYGDFVFTINVQIPKKLSQEQRDLITQLAKTMNEQPPVKKKGLFG